MPHKIWVQSASDEGMKRVASSCTIPYRSARSPRRGAGSGRNAAKRAGEMRHSLRVLMSKFGVGGVCVGRRAEVGRLVHAKVGPTATWHLAQASEDLGEYV